MSTKLNTMLAGLDDKVYLQAPDTVMKLAGVSTKMSDLFLRQVEALQRLRDGGSKQKVEVSHVHVHQGGQAVVGVIEGSRKGKKGKR